MESTKVDYKKMLVPKLRFKEFSGEWINRKLGELILKLDSGVSVNSIDEPIDRIDQFGILKTSCISSGKFYPEQNKKIIEEDIIRAKLNPVKGSILISRMNTPQLVGHSGFIEKDYPNLFVPDRLWMTIIDTKNAIPKLLSIVLSSEKIMGMISNIATGTSGSMKNISKPNLLNIEIHFPNLPEQQKIASFLSAIDEKIQQLTRKKELLEQYKRGVMQELLSGKLRFKDDNENEYPEWEETGLGDHIDLISGYAFKGEDISEKPGGIPLMRGINITEGYVRHSEEIDRYFHGDTDGLEMLMLKKGDLVLGMDGSKVGKNSALITEFDVGSLLVQRVARIRSLATSSIQFIYQHIRSTRFYEYVDTVNTSSGIPHISSKQIKEFKISFPVKEEQQKIANYLSSIDIKIESVTIQIAQSQTFKKGLLQQMFV